MMVSERQQSSQELSASGKQFFKTDITDRKRRYDAKN